MMSCKIDTQDVLCLVDEGKWWEHPERKSRMRSPVIISALNPHITRVTALSCRYICHQEPSAFFVADSPHERAWVSSYHQHDWYWPCSHLFLCPRPELLSGWLIHVSFSLAQQHASADSVEGPWFCWFPHGSIQGMKIIFAEIRINKSCFSSYFRVITHARDHAAMCETNCDLRNFFESQKSSWLLSWRQEVIMRLPYVQNISPTGLVKKKIYSEHTVVVGQICIDLLCPHFKAISWGQKRRAL